MGRTQRRRISTLLRVGRTTSTRLILPSSSKIRRGSSPKAGRLGHLMQRLPEDVRQEADQDMGLDPLFGLVPDRADSQVALVDSERRFGLGQLDVRLPEVFGRPVGDVGAEQITALVERRPLTPRLVLLPGDDRPAVDFSDVTS